VINPFENCLVTFGKEKLCLSDHDYAEQYATLSIRCEALSGELEECSKNLDKRATELSKERTQCRNIEKEEQKIEWEITALRVRT
jgi:chromosome segregation ATPase